MRASARPFLLAFFFVGSVSCIPTFVDAEIAFHQFAITGDLAPGANDGAEFESFFGGVSINNLGGVAFQAFLRTGDGAPVTAGNDDALFAPIPGLGTGFIMIAREDETPPGLSDGAEFDFFLGTPTINDSGDVAFVAFLRGVSRGSENALFGPTFGVGSALGLIAREGDFASGTPSTFSALGRPTINASGDVAFSGSLNFNPPSVLIDNNVGLFRRRSGANPFTSLIFRENQSAPDVMDGAEFLNLDLPVFSASGALAFDAFLRTGSGDEVPIENADVIFGQTSGPGSRFSLIARSGNPVPGETTDFEFGRLGRVDINDAGDVAFAGELRTISATGDPETVYAAVFGPVAGSGSGFGVIAREGDLAPGVIDGAEFDSSEFMFTRAPSINNFGDIAFVGALRTGDGDEVTSDNDHALFAAIDGDLSLILRAGDPFSVTNPETGLDELRTIDFIISDREGLNDRRELAFQLMFTDGSQGIFVATIPEPGGGIILLLGCVLYAYRRRVGLKM